MDFGHDDHHHILLTALGSGILIVILIIATYSSSGMLIGSSSATVDTSSTAGSSSVSTSTRTKQVTSSSTNSSTDSHASTQNVAPQVSTGVVVPIFSSYSKSQLNQVNEVIQSKLAYPSVPMIVVINPSNGPGVSYNLNFSSEVKNMQVVNVTVLGYVPTIWGTRNIALVEADIRTYYEWYHVNGTYLDQMPNWEYDGPQGQWNYQGLGGTYMPAYFSNLTSYAKSLGMTDVVANSGADIPQNLVGTVNTIGIFENTFAPAFFGDPSLTGLGGWHMDQNKSNFAFFSYGLSSLNPYYVVAAADYVGYLFLTNGGIQHPYVVLPPYFNQIVATLASMVSITVRSEVLNGTQISGGFETIVTQPDGISSMGYTPFTFNKLSGSVVTISAENFGGYIFNHWSDGSTSPVRNVTSTQAMTLISYYTG